MNEDKDQVSPPIPYVRITLSPPSPPHDPSTTELLVTVTGPLGEYTRAGRITMQEPTDKERDERKVRPTAAISREDARALLHELWKAGIRPEGSAAHGFEYPNHRPPPPAAPPPPHSSAKTRGCGSESAQSTLDRALSVIDTLAHALIAERRMSGFFPIVDQALGAKRSKNK